jgi:hypothetical protein
MIRLNLPTWAAVNCGLFHHAAGMLVNSDHGTVSAGLSLEAPSGLTVATSPHRDTGGVPDLDPRRARRRSIRAVDFLGNNALGAKPASVREHGRAILSDVFAEQDASVGVAQQPRQGVLAVEKRQMAEILASCSIKSKA